MRTRILTIAGLIAAGCLSVIVSATPAQAQTVDGCNDTPSTSANLADTRRDFFHSGHAYVRTGGFAQADFDTSVQTDYVYCRKVVGSDKMKISRFRLCATKNDNTDPHWTADQGPGVPVFLRGFKGVVEFNTAGGDLFWHSLPYLTWDGNGSTGDKKCSDWWPYFASADNHWMLLTNTPYIAADGDTDIANISDTSWQIFDDNTGARIHFFHPWDDNPV